MSCTLTEKLEYMKDVRQNCPENNAKKEKLLYHLVKQDIHSPSHMYLGP